MFQKIKARNNTWNRKYDFTNDEGSGFLVDQKNGLVFFAWKSPDKTFKFYKCEEGIFSKSFDVSAAVVGHKFDPDEKIEYLRYPVEM